jgi:hypothetical protein
MQAVIDTRFGRGKGIPFPKRAKQALAAFRKSKIDYHGHTTARSRAGSCEKVISG